MDKIYLHKHREFTVLLRILGDELQILPALIEKDYWLMHVLYGLKNQGLAFELKGGTSLSKGYKVIERFSEDIDIYIHPPTGMAVEEDPKKEKDNHVESRRIFSALRANFAARYAKTPSLYYKGQPPFEEVLAIIQKDLQRL